MNIIWLFYAPASTISGIKCLPIFLVFFYLFMFWLMRTSSFISFNVKNVLTIFWQWAYMMMVITEIRRVDNLLTMSVHHDGYYRNTPCWQSFNYVLTWWWLLQKYAVLTIFWPGAYMMMVITEIRRVDNLLTRSVHDDGYYRKTPCWQSFD